MPKSIARDNLLKSTTVVGFMTFLSRISGLIRDIIYARLFGALPLMDAFLVAFRVPNSFRRFFAEGSFSRAFIPVLSDYEENENEEGIRELIDRTAGTLGLILFFITFVGVIFSPLLIFLFAPGFLESNAGNDRYELSIEMLRLTFPYLLFISLTALCGAVLNTKKHFWATAFNPIILNIVLILFAVLMSPRFEKPGTALALGVFIAGILQLLFLLPFLKNYDRLPRPKWGWNHSGVKRVIKLMIPSLIGSSASQINLLINTLIASFLATGSVSWIYYSDRLLEFPVGVFGVALSTVVLPFLSKENALDNQKQFKETLRWGLSLALLVSVPSAAGLFLLSGPLISTIFLGGSFSGYDLMMTDISLRGYSVGIIGLCMVLVLSPAFYAREDTKTPLRYGLITLLVNVILSIVLVSYLVSENSEIPHLGLALSFSIASITNAVLLLYQLINDGLIEVDKDGLKHILRISLATIGMIAFLITFNPDNSLWVSSGIAERIRSLFFLISLSVIIYFSILFLLGFRFKDLRIETTSQRL
ncbi:MAG: murein biosynthesis integral membrane protein MurJ [Gammaproteobacteria bacterium]|jgi:putative peptidoglycan lipid II flippase|nr:murein biosynthesis integral membrane protein MurJ [Gammaproteobacteria bacterium]MBQ08889.1 murein biosynthesis integral membrane protein MurJ [Gammaproteobacteria bacterium]MDP6146376.1 murein biosynthesis integral membrane protein MurJ [Gammaproteobacteria bacterium]HJL80768.1 murein biosynthesis integral membrane protein MurJ [Gammaproteobacteria bacterium]HJM08535.1 murein biosynthesis integral membrane protein MurJ [Gammaproteobacteria bacterium]|tara:strand:+ start:20007 stop:21605 length:1599 start_codon:yes stop_codon:yes gene_type:complete